CYDVVLMDVQMPVMDGYEATELIRKELNSNVPVIAMTAHTIREEHEKCKKAGMNDHIGKPFKKEELYAKLMQLTHPEAEPVMTTEEKTNEKSERSRLLNLSQVQAMAGGDKAFVNEVLDIFIKDTPKAISTIEAGIQEKDYPAIKHWAHTLKSSMNLFGLKDTLGTILIQMEDMARNRQPLDEIGPLFNTLKSTGSQLIAEARLLRASA
ncbi:MAG: response regulator, partial [Bacteroidia bacterium]